MIVKRVHKCMMAGMSCKRSDIWYTDHIVTHTQQGIYCSSDSQGLHADRVAY